MDSRAGKLGARHRVETAPDPLRFRLCIQNQQPTPGAFNLHGVRRQSQAFGRRIAWELPDLNTRAVMVSM